VNADAASVRIMSLRSEFRKRSLKDAAESATQSFALEDTARSALVFARPCQRQNSYR